MKHRRILVVFAVFGGVTALMAVTLLIAGPTMSVRAEPGAVILDEIPSDLMAGAASFAAVKTVTPVGQIKYGDELTYTVVISAQPGVQLGLFDPLDDSTFVRFLEQPPGITHDAAITGTLYVGGGITGTLTVTPTNQITVSFVVQVGVPATPGLTVDVTNRACIYPFGGTLGGCIWSNEVTNPAFRPYPAIVVKSVTPTTDVAFGGELTYTLVISAKPGTPVVLYDPLEGTDFARFVLQPPGITRIGKAVIGGLTITPTNQVTVTFVAQVELPVAALRSTTITNRACVHLFGTTVIDCYWSNEVANLSYWPYDISLPLVLRNR